MMLSLLFAGVLAAGPPDAVGRAPTPVQLSEALAQAQGARPRISSVRCTPSSPGYVRCTYLELKGLGYSRWAVLVSRHGGRWTVSEGPMRARAPNPVRKASQSPRRS